MLKLLTAAQIKEVDKYTISSKLIESIDLMEQASLAFVKVFVNYFPDTKLYIQFICGQGNNGGDGFAIARLLYQKGYHNITVNRLVLNNKFTADNLTNYEKLKCYNLHLIEINSIEKLNLENSDVIIDAILGSGLNKPLSGELLSLIHLTNSINAKIISIDVPTGFNCEGIINQETIKSDLTICFQKPKINFFFPESKLALKKFEVVDIGLDEDYINRQPSCWKLIDLNWTLSQLKIREKFTHKGTYGHALIIAGDINTMGAALISGAACLQSGVGLLTLSVPESGLIALNVKIPESMYLDRNRLYDLDFDKYNAIAIGSGLGMGKKQNEILNCLLNSKKPLIIDADALNIIAEYKDLLELIPINSILTPHVKEFDRLFGKHNSWWERLQKAKTEAKRLSVIIVLKNQYTFICLPSGDICINTSGNPVMAQGGMGDALTGMITAFIAQGYSSDIAVLLAVYLHGSVGDELAKSRAVVSASYLVDNISLVLNNMFKEKNSF